MPTAIVIDADNAEVRKVELENQPELNEVLTLDDGLMYEVTSIEVGTAKLKHIEVEEDWGQ